MELNEVEAEISRRLSISPKDAETIVKKAISSREIDENCTADRWLKERFIPNCVEIDNEGYARMCIDALKILSTTAKTDYGASRQRDLSQLWADMTRGYLGEMAFIMFLKRNWRIDAKLGHEIGQLDDYLPMDIHSVKREGESEYRLPGIKIGVKAVKWNAIWLDIPGAQFLHSDVHVLVKTGTGQDSLFAFLKSISVFRDKVLKEGTRIEAITQKEAEEMFERLPSFRPIAAYICGFVPKSATFDRLPYEGRMGRKHFTITSWNGPINPGDLEEIKRREPIPTEGKVGFEGIGQFAHDKGYLFSAGKLIWQRDSWKQVLDKL